MHLAIAGYRIVVTGHSLGAGVAAFVTLLLRRTLPRVTGVGYATPTTMTLDLAMHSAAFFTTVVLGDDIVPRISVGAVQTLVRQAKVSGRCAGRSHRHIQTPVAKVSALHTDSGYCGADPAQDACWTLGDSFRFDESLVGPRSPSFADRGARCTLTGPSIGGGGGRCPPRGWQQGREQPTAHGTVHVVRRCEILVRGGRRVGQEGVRDMGTQERHETGGGATQTHRTREPHQEGQGRAQQTRRRGTARQERQPEQREQGTRMERMVEHAHGRQRQ